MNKTFLKLAGGIFGLCIFLFLAYMTIIKRKGAGLILGQGIKISFANVEGLKFGNTVFIKGLPFGDVRKIRIKEDRVFVDILFEEKIQFYRDYTVVLKNFSVLGKKAIYINPGRDKYGPVIPGTTLKGKTIENPFDYAAVVFNENKENLKNFLDNIASITKKIDNSSGSFSLLLNNPVLYTRTTRTLKNAQKLLIQLEDTYRKYRTEAGTASVIDAFYQLDD